MECGECGRLRRSSSSGGSSPARPNPFNRIEQGDARGQDDHDDELINMANARLEFVDEPRDRFQQICRTCRSMSTLAGHSSYPLSPGSQATFVSRSFHSASNGSLPPANQDPKPAWYDDYVADDDEPLLQDDSMYGPQPLDDLDHCHAQLRPGSSQAQRAKKQLIISCVLCLIFMIAEVVGGYLSNSLAVMTDAAHMFSDLGSFLISLFALWLGGRPPSKRMSFGYHRAEILGALVSVVIIWVLTGVLVYTAIMRIIHREYDIDADVMIIVAGVGVAMNILMGFVLHSLCHCHTHSHGMGQGSGHSHSTHSHDNSNKQNINVRAAFIHVVGDFVQSVGVLIAAFVIRYKPEYKLADPICTFVFSILVLITTLSILKDAIRVLMEGFPPDINYVSIKSDLQSLEGVKAAHSLHIWSLTVDKNALTVHLAVDNTCDSNNVLRQANRLIRQKYHIYQSTVQTEPYDHLVMSSCNQCKEP